MDQLTSDCTASVGPAPAVRVPPLFAADDGERIDEQLSTYFRRARAAYATDTRSAALFDQMAAFVLRGGKRIRPRLCLAGFRLFAADAAPRPVWRVAASLELLHGFILAHDDIIDGCDSRRGGPALHAALGRVCGVPGEREAALGIVAGDLLCVLGMRLLGRSGLRRRLQARATRLVADMLVETGLGGALEVVYESRPLPEVSEEQLRDLYVRKSARYSLGGPLRVGAALAGARGPVLAALQRFGDPLGLAYQIQNDLDALTLDPTGVRENPDLDGGKRTLVVRMAYRLLDEAGRSALLACLDGPPSLERRQRLLGLIHESGAIHEAMRLAASLRRAAVASLDRSPLDAHQVAALSRLVEAIDPKR